MKETYSAVAVEDDACVAEHPCEHDTWYVVNDAGDLAGHDLDENRAAQCLKEMLATEPGEGWEMFDASDKE